MSQNWSLRDELVAASQRWPLIVLFILVGALVGLGIAWIMPSPYEASKDIYVGLDVYRAFRDRNIPFHTESLIDYKNWQMENLEMVLVSQPVLDKTLAKLRSVDEHWHEVNSSQLLAMMKVNWRSAGRWRLKIENPQKRLTSQAVRAWETSALEVIRQDIVEARQVMVIDEQIRSLADKNADLEARKAQVENASRELLAWKVEGLDSLHPGDKVDEKLHQRGEGTVSSLQLGTVLQPVLETYPQPGSPVETYQDWAKRVEIGLEEEISNLQAQIDRVNTGTKNLNKRYAEASQQSKGLSANFVIEPVPNEPIEVGQPRPIGQMALIGGLIGLLAWLAFWLGKIALK
jgi:hypothetical protein